MNKELLFWGKSRQDEINTNLTHSLPLIFHMINVANIAYQMYLRTLSPAVKKEMQNLYMLDDNEIAVKISFLAGLHDIGKAVLHPICQPIFEGVTHHSCFVSVSQLQLFTVKQRLIY